MLRWSARYWTWNTLLFCKSNSGAPAAGTLDVCAWWKWLGISWLRLDLCCDVANQRGRQGRPGLSRSRNRLGRPGSHGLEIRPGRHHRPGHQGPLDRPGRHGHLGCHDIWYGRFPIGTYGRVMFPTVVNASVASEVGSILAIWPWNDVWLQRKKKCVYLTRMRPCSQCVRQLWRTTDVARVMTSRVWFILL